MSGTGYTEAFGEFVAASIAVWREIDRLTDEDGGAYPGLPQSTALRQRERRAWGRFRGYLDGDGRVFRRPESAPESDWVNALDLHKHRIRQLQEALCECPHHDVFQADLHDETCPVFVVTREASNQEGQPE